MAGKAFLHKKSLIDKFRDEHSKGTGYIQAARARRTWNNPITRHKRTNKLNDWISSFAGKRHIRKLSRFNALKESNMNTYEDYSRLKLGETYRLSKGKAIVNRLNKLLAGIGGIVEYDSDLDGCCKIYFRGSEDALHQAIKSTEWNKIISEMDSISDYQPKFDIIAVKAAAYKLRQKYSDTGDGAGIYAIDRMLNHGEYRKLHDMLVNQGYLDKSESFNKPKVTIEMLLDVLNYYKQNYRWSDELVSRERENTFEWLETYASVFVPAYTESGVEAGLQAIANAEETGVMSAEIAMSESTTALGAFSKLILQTEYFDEAQELKDSLKYIPHAWIYFSIADNDDGTYDVWAMSSQEDALEHLESSNSFVDVCNLFDISPTEYPIETSSPRGALAFSESTEVAEKISHEKGHKNSKGEDAPWVIRSHTDNKVLASFPTKAEAEEQLKRMQQYKNEAKKNRAILKSSGPVPDKATDASAKRHIEELVAALGETTYFEEITYHWNSYALATEWGTRIELAGHPNNRYDITYRDSDGKYGVHRKTYNPATRRWDTQWDKHTGDMSSSNVNDAISFIKDTCDIEPKEESNSMQKNESADLKDFTADVLAELVVTFHYGEDGATKLVNSYSYYVEQAYVDGDLMPAEVAKELAVKDKNPYATESCKNESVAAKRKFKGKQIKESLELVDTIIVPQWLWYAYESGDTSYLEDDEIETFHNFQDEYKDNHLADDGEEPVFHSYNDVDNLGGVCYTVNVYAR